MNEVEWFMLLLVAVIVFLPVNLKGRDVNMPATLTCNWNDLSPDKQDQQTLFCMVQGCQVVVEHDQFLCERHLKALPRWTKDRLVKHQDGRCWRGKVWKDSEMSRDVNEALRTIGKT